MMQEILDILYPPHCAFCGKLLEHSGSGVCPACEKSLPYAGEGDALQMIGGYPSVRVFYYEAMVEQGIHALKFDKTAWRASIFGRYIAQAAAEYLGGQFDTVTYVPVSWQRRCTRTFDQACLLAQAAADVWGVKAEPTLRKIRHNRPQSSLDDPRQRQSNVQGAYRPLRRARIAGRRFLLIDDVITTGSTMSACAGTLLEAGAASVVCASLAGGHPPKEAPQGGLQRKGAFTGQKI